MENPIKMDDLGATSIFGNTHLFWSDDKNRHLLGFRGRTVIDDVIYDGNLNPGFPGFGHDGFADPSCDTHKESLIC